MLFLCLTGAKRMTLLLEQFHLKRHFWLCSYTTSTGKSFCRSRFESATRITSSAKRRMLSLMLSMAEVTRTRLTALAKPSMKIEQYEGVNASLPHTSLNLEPLCPLMTHKHTAPHNLI